MGSAVQPARENSPLRHDCHDLVAVFSASIGNEYSTVLVGGAAEPEYVPAGPPTGQARILFTEDYFASALHEVAHWCIAGTERRRLPDYGYWYAPDGRTAQQQALFEQVEIKPQALEWIFSAAARFRFRLSADNLAQGVGPSLEFAEAVAGQARYYATHGLPRRAERFARALTHFYGGDYWSRRFLSSALE